MPDRPVDRRRCAVDLRLRARALAVRTARALGRRSHASDPSPLPHRRSQHEQSEVLVDADWVAEHGSDADVVLVEVDEDTTAYDGGHIAGAVKLDWKKDLQDPVRRDFVNREQFEALLSERGIANDDTVVLYGGNNNWFAAYAYWYFKLYGHSDVRLLDGGRKKWELDARQLSAETVTRPATRVQGGRARPEHPRLPRRGHRRDRQPTRWSTCAAPTSSPAGCSPRRTCRRSRRSAAATSRPR